MHLLTSWHPICTALIGLPCTILSLSHDMQLISAAVTISIAASHADSVNIFFCTCLSRSQLLSKVPCLPDKAARTAQDLPRTFPLNAWVGSAEGQGALRHVLLAFSVHKPDVGYCQSMNYVAAMLLLCLDLSEERAFWVMVALIDDNGSAADCAVDLCHAKQTLLAIICK